MNRFTENDDTLLIDESIFIDGTSDKGNQQTALKIDHLQAGEYLIYLKVDWIKTRHEQRKVVINIFGNSQQISELR